MDSPPYLLLLCIHSSLGRLRRSSKHRCDRTFSKRWTNISLRCPWVTNTEYWAAYSRSPTGWAPCTFTVMQHFPPFARQIITLKLILYSWLFCSVYIQVIPPKSFLLSRVKQWSAEHWPKYCSGFCWVSRASKQLVGTNSCATSARRHFLDNFFFQESEKSK